MTKPTSSRMSWSPRPPERLVHVIGRPMLPGTYRVDALIPDEHAQISGIHCRPSPQGEIAIGAAEVGSDGHYIGIIHSHPVTFPEPSRQDEHAAWDTLGLNPHLEDFFVGVVISARHDVLPEHSAAIGAGQLSVHAASRSGGSFAPVRPMVGAADFLDTLAARMPPESVASLVPRRVAIFGAGSLGSMIAETMVRNGVSAVHLIDPDRVEAVNLSRSTYTSADTGNLKVDALANRLQAINPLATVTTTAIVVDDATVTACESISRWADLVIAVTDDPRAQAIRNRNHSTRPTPPRSSPASCPAATLGEIVIILPGLTTCYRCVAGHLRLLNSRGDRDYGTGRIKGAVALWRRRGDHRPFCREDRPEPAWATPRRRRQPVGTRTRGAQHDSCRTRSTCPRSRRGPQSAPTSAHAPVGLDGH